MDNEMKKYGRGWVCVKEGTKKEIDWAEPEADRNAENVMLDFGRSQADHFEIYFRDSNGKLNPVDAEALPEDFE